MMSNLTIPIGVQRGSMFPFSIWNWKWKRRYIFEKKDILNFLRRLPKKVWIILYLQPFLLMSLSSSCIKGQRICHHPSSSRHCCMIVVLKLCSTTKSMFNNPFFGVKRQNGGIYNRGHTLSQNVKIKLVIHELPETTFVASYT